MAKVLCLAQSGFGKSTSIGNIPELGIKGLDPSETFIVSVTSKPLPFKGSAVAFPICQPGDLKSGRRVVTDNAKAVEEILLTLAGSPF
jgi:hypothetical protein